MDRRNFTKTVGLAAIGIQTYAASSSLDVFNVNINKSDRIPLGLCNHSLRSSRLNAQQLIQYAIENQLDSVMLNTLNPFKSTEESHLVQLKELSDSHNISLYIGAGSISEDTKAYKGKYGSPKGVLIEGIRVAKILGSPTVACRIGNIDDRYHRDGIKGHMKVVTEVMKSARVEALDAGIKFAIENHAGDLRAEEILKIVEETGTDICGILYDPANAVWVMEDPMETLQKLKKHILCTSVRDVVIWETEDGAKYQCKAVGEGILDFKKYAKVMAKNCPGVPIHVESISNSVINIPFKTKEFLNGFPDVSQEEIDNFSKLASKGKPQEILSPKNGESKKEFDIKLQEQELQKSFTYLRNHCNTGLKLDNN